VNRTAGRLVVISDSGYADTAVEEAVLGEAGLRVVRTQTTAEDDLIGVAQGASGLLVQYAAVTDRVLQALPTVSVVSRYGAGYDNVDVEAATRRGVWVANTPVYGSDEVALHAFSLVLAVVRGLLPLDRLVRSGDWTAAAPAATGGLVHPSGLTLGVLGLGRIGRRVAELGSAVFGRVVGHDPGLAGDPPQVPNLPFGELVAAANVLSVHVPLTAATHHLVDAGVIASLRPPRMVVNTSRGAVVDTVALAGALTDGTVAGAALDVLEHEPPRAGDPVLAAPRLLLTPHSAWYTAEAEEDVRRRAAMNVRAALTAGAPLTPVNRITVDRER